MASLANPMPGPGEFQFGLSTETNDHVLGLSMIGQDAVEGDNQSARSGGVESWEEGMARLIASAPDHTAQDGDPDEPGLNWDGGMEM